ncbi:ATP-binding protein [Streptomyces sp. NPDC007088]|uniref:sensor histidine kinase n=1 Tax=Streptomyces sp. NPDC007088 TaxID=3364773 RepID=UPI00369CBDB9
MSHLRAPAPRADRRDGGARHGRPGSPLPETHIRTLLLRTAVLPAVAVALSGTAAVLMVLGAGPHPTTAVRIVLAVAAAVAVAALCGAVLAARRATRTLLDRIAVLRSTSARRQSELRGLVDRLRRGEVTPVRESSPRPDRGGDGLDLLADELGRSHDVAMASVVQASKLSSQAGSDQKVEVFVNLARRLQSLVHREIQLLDELENEIEDPALLKGLFHVDHLATRTRRHAENLAVLGGAMSRRQWSRPVTMTEVLRSAVAEVEQYSRVKLVPPVEGTLRGQVVADVIHLLAELVENATQFSSPHTPVLLRAGRVAAGLAVEVEDRGLGLPVAEQHRMNALLADPDQVNMASLLQDGRIGLYVVATLARRHGIAVRLQSNIYGGVQAVLVLPATLLGEEPGELEPVAGDNTAPAIPLPRAERPASPPALPARPEPRPQAEPEPAPPTTGTGRETATGTTWTTGIAATTGATGTTGTKREETSGTGPDRRSVTSPVPPAAAHRAPETAARPGPVVEQTPDAKRTPVVPQRQARRAPDEETSEGAPPPLPVRGAPGSHTARRAPSPAPGAAPRRASSPSPRASSPESAGTGRPSAPRLPVRGVDRERPNPAEARPGIRPGELTPVDTPGGITALTLRDGTPVAGPAARPPGLPRRQAQTHMAPQLRRGPQPDRPEDDAYVGHDPGLMAAFRTGFGRGEATDPPAVRVPEPRLEEPPGTEHADRPHPSTG